MTLAQPAKWEKFIWPLATAALLLLFWHYAVIYSGTKVFPSPAKVLLGAEELANKGLLLRYIGDSLRRVAFGYLLALVLAIPFGLTLGWYPAASQVVNPMIQIMRPISPIAWIPLAIVFFGVGDSSATFLIFLGSFF